MSETQYRCLDLLCASEKLQILSPAIIARNLDVKRPTVSRLVSELVDRGLAEKIEDGYYVATDRGRNFIAGELDASDLETDE